MAERYRLEALYKIKERNKKRAEIMLARAIQKLEEEKEKLEKLKEEKKELIQKRKEARTRMDVEMQAGGFVGKGCRHVDFLRKMKEDIEEKEEAIEDQKEEIKAAEGGVLKARRDYIDAVKEFRVMEKHKDLWKKKIRHEMTQRDKKEMDELGQTIHQLKHWRGEKNVFEAN